jgi:hypothetical protein
MSIVKATSASWKFVQRDELGRQRWKWLRTAAGGAIASVDFPSYAAAVMDAVNKGFRPKSEVYLVESPGRLIRFEPGRRPLTVWLPASREGAGAAKAEGWRAAGADAGSAAAGKRVAGTRRASR